MWFASVLIAIACAAPIGRAADVSVQFDVQPRVLRVGEAAVASFTIRGMDNPPQPHLPSIDGFQIAFAGVERSFSFGTGGSDRTVTYRYRLVPLRAGTFDIGPFRYSIGSQDVELPHVPITVVAPDESTVSAENPSPEELLFAEISAPSTNLFSQQVFDLLISVYAADGINLAKDIALLNMPSVGLSVQPFQEVGSERVALNNRIYNVRRFTSKATALTSGQYNVAPTLRVQVLVQRERQRSRDPFWGDFDPFEAFFGRVEAQAVDLTPPPITLNIRPLPEEGRPPSFSGAVGRFDFRVEVKPTECAVGDPVTVTLSIMGEGNIENVDAPHIAAPETWRLYDVKLAAKDIQPQRAVGRKVFEVVAIPRTDGEVELPAVEFAYFDPEQQAYRLIRQGPFSLRIRPSSNVTDKVVQAAPESKTSSPKILGADIVYLKPPPKRWNTSGKTPPYHRPVFWAVQTVPLLFLLGVGFWQRRKLLLEENVAYARRTRAPRAARAGLKRAGYALRHNQRAEFFEALNATLAEYFGHRLNLPPGAVLSSDVLSRLRAGGLSEEHLKTLEEIYRRCEEERYAGGSHSAATGDIEEWKEWMRKLEDVLQACERVKL